MGVWWGYFLPPLHVCFLLAFPPHSILSVAEWCRGKRNGNWKGKVLWFSAQNNSGFNPTPPPLFREHLSSQPVSLQQRQLYQQHLVVWLRQWLRRYEWRKKLSWVSRRGRISRILNTNSCSGGWLVLLGCGLCFRILPGHFCCGIYLNRWDLGNRKNICKYMLDVWYYFILHM